MTPTIQLPLGLRGYTQTGMFSDFTPLHCNHSCMPNETSPSQSHAAKNELRCRLLGDLDHGAWCIRGTDDSTLVMDSPVPLKHHDPDILERWSWSRSPWRHTPLNLPSWQARRALCHKVNVLSCVCLRQEIILDDHPWWSLVHGYCGIL